MNIWIQYNTWFIYQYNLKAEIQKEMRVRNDTVPLSSMRRNMPFPLGPGQTAELSPSQQLQQKEAAATSVRTTRVKSCVGEICPLVDRESIFPSLHAVSGSVGYLSPPLRRWYGSWYWFWKQDNCSVMQFLLFPLKGEKWKTFLLKISNYISVHHREFPYVFLLSFLVLYVGYSCHYIRIIPFIIS